MKSFNEEVNRLKKGIRIAWIINFLIMFLIILSTLIFSMLDYHQTNQVILFQIMIFSMISLPISLFITFYVGHSSSKILISAPGGDAYEITEGYLYNIVEEMSIAARLKYIPSIYIINNTGVLNAYASADKTSSQVVITKELIDLLNRNELQAVIGHEIGHIATGDSQAMTKLVALTSASSIIIGFAWRMIFFSGNRKSNNSNNSSSSGINLLGIVIIIIALIFLIASPLLSKLAESYMSRERESRADAKSVEFTRNPNALASALMKLENSSYSKKKAKDFSKKIGNVAFFNPSKLKMNFSTHPSIKKRLSLLIQMGAHIQE